MKLPSSTFGFIKSCVRFFVIDWQSYPSLCDTLFSVYSMIRHYGFYPKRMIRHYVIHPPNCFSPRNVFQNGFNTLSKTVNHFLTISSKFCTVRTIRFCSNFTSVWSKYLGTASNSTAGWSAVPSGSARFQLFQTMTTARNRTEPPVNRRLGFEAAPYQIMYGETMSPSAMVT